MPKLTTNATVTTTQEVRLEPALRKKMLLKLREYQILKQKLDALKKQKEALTNEIGLLRDDVGEMSVSLEGFTVTLVAPTYKKFNEKRFVALGGDLKIYQQAVDEKPKKSFNKVTVPGEKEEHHGEE